MKIQNDSQYNTNDLKKILVFALKSWWKNYSARSGTGWIIKGHKNLKVHIYNRKNGPCTASYNGYYLNLNLWHHDLSQEIEKKKLAWVIRHEIEHLNGKHHKDMRGSYFLHWPDEHTKEDWILPFQVRPKEIKAKPKVDVQEVRYEKAKAYLALWQKRAKIAINKIKKYSRQKRRYEVIFAAKQKN